MVEWTEIVSTLAVMIMALATVYSVLYPPVIEVPIVSSSIEGVAQQLNINISGITVLLIALMAVILPWYIITMIEKVT